MKGFWIGVVATVLASVLGFLAIEGIKTFSGPDREISHTEFTTKFFFGSKKAIEWEKNVSNLDVESLDNRDRLTATVVVVENIGNDALQNQRVIIKPKYDDSYSAGVIDFQNDVVPGVEGEDTKMSIKNKVLYIDYSLLDTKEAHRFWVIHDRYATLNIIARNPKLTATGWTAKIYREDTGEDWTFELVIGAIFGAAAMLGFGVFLASKHSDKMVAAHGHDPKEFYETAQKKLAELKKENA